MEQKERWKSSLQSLWEESRELPWKPSRNNPLQRELTEALGIRILISFGMLLLPHICDSECVCACTCVHAHVCWCVCHVRLCVAPLAAQSVCLSPSRRFLCLEHTPLPHPHLGLYSLRVGGGLFSPEKPSLTPPVRPGASLVLPRPPTAGFLLPSTGHMELWFSWPRGPQVQHWVWSISTFPAAGRNPAQWAAQKNAC